MPHVLVGPVEAAEADADPQEALAAPQAAGGHRGLSQLQCLAAVHQHLNGTLHVHLEQVFQRVIVFVLQGIDGKITVLCTC